MKRIRYSRRVLWPKWVYALLAGGVILFNLWGLKDEHEKRQRKS